MFRFPARILSALAMLLLAVSPAFAQSKGPLVLAAASLQESLNAAADRWAAKGHPRPVLSFAGSSALARQIEAHTFHGLEAFSVATLIYLSISLVVSFSIQQYNMRVLRAAR